MKKKIVITGATSGIGKATMEVLANSDNHLILGCRNIPKAQKLVDEVKSKNKDARIDIFKLDLSSFKSIKDFSDAICKNYDSIGILFNNAGVFSDTKTYTKEGYEMTLGVNYIGTYYLTTLLMDIVEKGHNPQIINVCSRAALFGKFKLKDGAFIKQKHGFRAYSASKYLQLQTTICFANMYKDSKVKINAIHPGDVATGIWDGDSLMMKIIGPIMKKRLSSPEQGAVAGLYLIQNPPNDSGKFYEELGEVIEYDKYDEEFAKSILDATDKIIKTKTATF